MIEAPALPRCSTHRANTFLENPAPPVPGKARHRGGAEAICRIGYMIDNTTKTRAVFEINKG